MKKNDSPIEPSEARKGGGKARRIAFLALIAVLAAVAAVAVCLDLWLALPAAEVPASRLLPSEPFAYITLNLSRRDPAVAKIADLVKDRLTSKAGFLRKAAVSALLPGALPPSIAAIAGSNGQGGGAFLAAYADLGRLSKLVRLAGPAAAKALLKGSGKISSERLYGQRIWYGTGAGGRAIFSAYAIVGGTLVLGTSRTAVEDCCANFASAPEAGSRRASWGAAIDEAAAYRGAYIFAENRGGALSRIVEAASAKFSFSAFPSIGSVASVNGAVRILEDEVKGAIAFAGAAGGKSEEIASDVQFIYGAAKRVARSAGLRLQGEAAIGASGVGFAFSLPGYAEALAAPKKNE
jgi:hypothetical protein